MSAGFDRFILGEFSHSPQEILAHDLACAYHGRTLGRREFEEHRARWMRLAEFVQSRAKPDAPAIPHAYRPEDDI